LVSLIPTRTLESYIATNCDDDDDDDDDKISVLKERSSVTLKGGRKGTRAFSVWIDPSSSSSSFSLSQQLR
jgi:hypothetical protein